MKHLKKYKAFNEGKTSQFIMTNIMVVINLVGSLVKKIKGTYVPLSFKDKTMERKALKDIMTIFDYAFFDMLKYYLSKKYKQEAMKTSFTELIKSRSGVDVYKLIDSIISNFKEENIIFSSDPAKMNKQKEYLKETIAVVMKFKSSFKQIDDDVLESQELMNQLKELTELMKKLDPREIENHRNRSKEETLAAFDDVKSHLDDMEYQANKPKELDDILDKISEYGIESLSAKEKEDLIKYSNKK